MITNSAGMDRRTPDFIYIRITTGRLLRILEACQVLYLFI